MPGGTLWRASPPVTRVEITGRIAETGIENLKIMAPDRNIAYRVDPEFDGIVTNNVLDSWLSGLAFVDTTDSIDHNAERLTVVNVDVTQHDAVTRGVEPVILLSQSCFSSQNLRLDD